MRTYKIYLIRHGKTQGNIDGRFVGSTDIDICGEGADQILAHADKYEYPAVGRVYSSPMIRCESTAKLLYPEHSVVKVEDLREYYFGDFENMLAGDLKDNPDFLEWIRGNSVKAPPNGEDMQEFNARIIKGLNEVIMDMMANKVSEAAIITHGGVIMGLLGNCGLPKREALKWLVDNVEGYSVLINASLWGNTKTFEVCDKLPYGMDQEKDVSAAYTDIEE